MKIRSLKYSILAFFSLGLLRFISYGYLALEAFTLYHFRATASALQHDLALAWGYGLVPEPLPIEPTIGDLDSLPLPMLIARAADTHGVNPALIRAVMKVESNNNPAAISHAGAIGLMQVMPFNAGKRCGLPHSAKLWRESINVDCGTKILRQELETYKGDLFSALRAYNGGHKCAMSKACSESENYVLKVLARLGADTVGIL